VALVGIAGYETPGLPAEDGKLTERHLPHLVLAGAAGGIGAIFRAPLGAALVVCELLYRNMEFEHDAVVLGWKAS
jgi:H+/Cl- antiporter ClcA